MAEKTTYRVLREMQGDRIYAPGETRELRASDAAHLVVLGVLEKIPARSAKVAAPLKNKGE